MEDTLCGLRFSRFAALLLTKSTPRRPRELYGLALEYAGLTGAETVVDAYCGAGTIGPCCWRRRPKSHRHRNRARKPSRTRTKTPRATASPTPSSTSATTEEPLPTAGRRKRPPPGCDRARPARARAAIPPFLQAIIAAMRPSAWSMSPATPPTLARDAKLLTAGGYTAEKVVSAVDMFRWTGACGDGSSFVPQKSRQLYPH